VKLTDSTPKEDPKIIRVLRKFA